MALYRVDKRVFKEGDIIECNLSSYYEASNFAENKREIEDLLNERRPNRENPIRNECLFIFNELYDATRFWITMTDSSIYEVARCSSTKSYFRGDMNITDFMQHTTDKTVLQVLADQYWAPIFSFKPCIEILVNKVQVVRRLTTDEGQRRAAYSAFAASNKRIEALTFYKTQLCS